MIKKFKQLFGKPPQKNVMIMSGFKSTLDSEAEMFNVIDDFCHQYQKKLVGKADLKRGDQDNVFILTIVLSIPENDKADSWSREVTEHLTKNGLIVWFE